MVAVSTLEAPARPFGSWTYDHWVRWRMCTRKQHLTSETAANNWIYLLALSYGPEFRPGLVSYDCPYCDGWHVGHLG